MTQFTLKMSIGTGHTNDRIILEGRAQAVGFIGTVKTAPMSWITAVTVGGEATEVFEIK